jgi:hypothetical protein
MQAGLQPNEVAIVQRSDSEGAPLVAEDLLPGFEGRGSKLQADACKGIREKGDATRSVFIDSVSTELPLASQI